MCCIARAFGGQPLDRVLVEARGRVGYIVKPSVDDAVNTDQSEGVGFPLGDLFLFDVGLLEALALAFDSRDERRLGTLWGSAQPLPL